MDNPDKLAPLGTQDEENQNKNHIVFVLIVPCVKDNGGCQQICVVHGYFAKCECNLGYKLQTDEKSCKAGEIL